MLEVPDAPFLDVHSVCTAGLASGGCYSGSVTVSESPPRGGVIVDVEEDDVSFVVYREYYDCSDEEISFIPYYRHYYFVDDCDLYFLFSVARHTHQPIDLVVRTYYYDCDRDYNRLIVSYRVDPAYFFVELPARYNPAAPTNVRTGFSGIAETACCSSRTRNSARLSP